MNKRAFLGGMLLALSTLFAAPLPAQSRSMHYQTIDGVRVDYRWLRSSFFNKDSDAVITFQFTNESAFPVEVTFDVGFYREQQLMFESAENSICLLPGQTRRGARAGLRFTATGITLPMTEKDWFSWDLLHFEVREVTECP